MGSQKEKRERKFLLIVKGDAASRFYVELAKEACRQGHKIFIIAEGKAIKNFEGAGLPLFFKGTPDPRSLPFTLDALPILEHLAPDILCTGVGKSMHLENEFARAFYRYKAKDAKPMLFVVFEHEPGLAFCLGLSRPTIILVPDMSHKKEIQESYSRVPIVREVGQLPDFSKIVNWFFR